MHGTGGNLSPGEGMSCNRPVTSESCATPEDNPGQELTNEHYRLQTFTSFPSRCPVSSSALAQAGFFYTGEGDSVKCFSCHATIGGWQPGDSAVGRHRAISPSCKFVSSCNSWKNDRCPVLSNCHPRIENGSADTSLQPAHDLSSDLCADYLLRSGQVVDLSDASYPRNPAMCREEIRLRSFSNWPSYAPVTPKELASAGLYYTGIDDQVECFCCGGKLRNWEPCDQAWSEHSRHFPRCFFVLGRDVGNLPNHSAGAELERSDICNTALPHNPSMANYETRIKTFVTWRYPVSKEQLAQAGFYHIGNGDDVVCFYCGGGLQKWEVGEDPWEQHAKWFPGPIQMNLHRWCNCVGCRKDAVKHVYCIHLLSWCHKCALRHLCDTLCSYTSSYTSGIEATGQSLHLTDEELLQNHLVQDAMRMGFSLEEIRKTLERRRHLSTEHYISVEALVTDLVNAQSDKVHHEASESTLQKDLSTEEKLRRLQEEKLCKICMDKTISVVLIPCGHLVACRACAEAVDKCPLCCTVISKRQTIYTS